RKGFDRSRIGFVLVANLYRSADKCRGFDDADPVYRFEFEYGRVQGVFFADHDTIGLGFDGQDVERFARGKAEALALPDGEIVNAVVTAEDSAGWRDNFALSGGHGHLLFRGVGVDELHVVAVRDEAELHALGLLRHRERGAARDFTDFVLRDFAKGKFAVGALRVRKATKEIGRILGGIVGTKKLGPLRGRVVANTSVVAGGEPIGADLPSHSQQRLELYVGVAIGTGDGSAAAEIVVHKGADDALFKLVFEVHHVVRKVEMLGDALGVVNVIERAAAVLRAEVGALKFGEPALIPELHGEADDRAALLLQHGCDGRRVHTARHGHGDKARLDCGTGR